MAGLSGGGSIAPLLRRPWFPNSIEPPQREWDLAFRTLVAAVTLPANMHNLRRDVLPAVPWAATCHILRACPTCSITMPPDHRAICVHSYAGRGVTPIFIPVLTGSLLPQNRATGHNFYRHGTVDERTVSNLLRAPYRPHGGRGASVPNYEEDTKHPSPSEQFYNQLTRLTFTSPYGRSTGGPLLPGNHATIQPACRTPLRLRSHRCVLPLPAYLLLRCGAASMVADVGVDAFGERACAAPHRHRAAANIAVAWTTSHGSVRAAAGAAAAALPACLPHHIHALRRSRLPTFPSTTQWTCFVPPLYGTTFIFYPCICPHDFLWWIVCLFLNPPLLYRH